MRLGLAPFSVLALLVACANEVPSEVEPPAPAEQAVAPAAAPTAKLAAAGVTKLRVSAVQALRDELARGGEIALQNGMVELPDGTRADSLAVQQERASIADRLDEVTAQLGRGEGTLEAREGLQAEAAELFQRLAAVTEGLAPPTATVVADEAPKQLSSRAQQRLQALRAEINPSDPSRAHEYTLRKLEIYENDR